MRVPSREAAARPPAIPASLAAAGLVLALAAAASFLLPWHDVTTPDWGAAFCWAPDCHPTPTPTHDRCTGLADAPAGLAWYVGLAGLQLGVLLVRRRPRTRLALFLLVLMPLDALVGLLGVAVLSGLSHILSSTRTLPGNLLFWVAATLLSVLALAQVGWAIRRLRSP